MAAHHNVNPAQMKLFMGGQEMQEASNSSTDTDAVKGEKGWSKMWEKKLSESKQPAGTGHGSGLHASLLEHGYQRDQHKPFDPAPTLFVQGNGVQQGEGHHRVAAAADIERTTGKHVWLPTNYVALKHVAIPAPMSEWDPDVM